MKKRMKNNNISLAAMRRKLYSALAMLLISSIMMVSASYAWLVLSTAPEVTGIATQVGANGSLEIALLDTNSYNDVTLVKDMDIDESAAVSATSSNLTWGNLVDLSGAEYGLSSIVLNPGRLSIKQNGNDESGALQYAVNPSILKTPIYSEDGRITGLEETAISTVYKNNKFAYVGGVQDYGVRAIGTVSNMSEFQLSINAAKSSLLTSMSSARTKASVAMSNNGNALANIAIQYATKKSDATYSKTDVQALLKLATGMKESLDQIESALRQVFVGYISTAESGINADNFQTLKAEIENKETSFDTLKMKYPGLLSAHSSLSTYIAKLVDDQIGVDEAIADYNEMLNGGSESFTWEQISSAMAALVEYESMTLNGKGIAEVADMDMDGLISLIANGGLNVAVPTGSGLISDIADFAGNYSAEVSIESFEYNGWTIPSVTAKIAATTTYNPVHLTECSNMLGGFTAGGSSGSGEVISDYYGYVLDMAFRTNVADSHLQLQTESTQRIYSDSNSTATQGGGSYMEFTSSAGLSATKMVKLMGGIRVVFVDDSQNILAMAALDTTLGKDAYRILDETEQSDSGYYAVLTKGTMEQNSDYITNSEYSSLPEISVVQFESATGKVKAPLYLYDFSMTVSTAGDTDTTESGAEGDTTTGTTEIKYTGGITLGSKKSSSAITELPESRAQQVSVIVYLDGSYVNNSMVAANSAQSMSGILNLQFSSDATLVPANNQELFDGNDEEIDDDQESEGDNTGNDGTGSEENPSE